MAQDYTEYLAANVLNEQQLVSYRSLSRALKVHSNLAKQMLFEFHSQQNGKKPGSVHATYLITGTKRPTNASQTNGTQSQNDDDTVVQSSPPFPSSSMPPQEETEEVEQVPVKSIVLVKEELLEKAKASFVSITGIHIYSLQVNGLSDVQTLSECNRKIASNYASEDPQEVWKQYGTIQNPNAKRRTTRAAPPPPAPKASAAEVKPSTMLSKAAPKPSAPASKPDSKQSSTNSTPEPSKPAPSKKESSSIFKSFAKSKAPPKKTESQDSAATSQEKVDTTMTGFSDDDMDDDAVAEEMEPLKEPTGKSKKERAADLAAMMDQEDEPMDDATVLAAEPEPVEDDSKENAIDKPEEKPAAEEKETVTVENGRRRGRRRIMKKKTVKDEDGYLVTKEEAAWESFSEDEPPPKKLKPSTTAKPAAGAKKGAKPGQGNIMSFFGKK